MIYFDNAASTPMENGAYILLCQDLKNDFANPAAKHKLGISLSKKIEEARAEFLSIFNLTKFNVIFTSSATESNNTIIKNFENGIVYFECDHPSVVNACKGKGLNIADDLCSYLSEQTKLVILTGVNSQSGHVINLEKIVSEIRRINPRTKIHLDAVQAAFKINMNYNLVDSFTIAAHKIGGPKGISALFFRDDFIFEPLINGGGHELSLRSSTPSSPLIMSFLEASRVALKNYNTNFANANKIKEIILSGLSKIHKNISFPFESEKYLTSPYILCVKFIGIPSDILLRHLETKDVFISSTTACSSKISGHNPTLSALGIEEKFHKNILRISFGFNSTLEEANSFLEIFESVIKEIKFLIK